jgi:WD40 repeat protein
VSIFETYSGKLLCKATCGEITTGMCFSQNGKHLITTSSIGVIYIWKLPENVSSKLVSN